MSVINKSTLLSWRNDSREIHKGVTASLNEWRSESRYGKVTIFLSHKHDENEELDAAVSLLKRFGVNIYVDWQDGGMPTKTSGETAKRIKSKVKECKKFIFLATEGAISSRWCNWELGFGDSQRFMDNLAIFPIKNDYQSGFSGSEYLNIYSAIEHLEGSKTVGGTEIPKGWYVMNPADENGHRSFTPIRTWLMR